MQAHRISFSASPLRAEEEVKNKKGRENMMCHYLKTKENRCWPNLALLMLSMVLMAGCGFGAKPSYKINQYTLEYPSPVMKELSPLNELIKVEQFSVAQTFNTSAMVYKEGPNLRNVDPYNRWRTKPGEMTGEYLVRDLRNCGLFRAVISYDDSMETRYLLEGQVDEFLEVSEKDGRKAILGLNVIFLDLKKRDAAERVIFQRDYKTVEPYPERTPTALAQGMSRAMEKISRQIILDLRDAVKNR
jgi:cholesterol transport system auxiliary component